MATSPAEQRGQELQLGHEVGRKQESGQPDGLNILTVVGVSAGPHRDRDPGLVRGAAERERDVLLRLNRSSQRVLSAEL
jgi:hypothetical protein